MVNISEPVHLFAKKHIMIIKFCILSDVSQYMHTDAFNSKVLCDYIPCHHLILVQDKTSLCSNCKNKGCELNATQGNCYIYTNLFHDLWNAMFNII